jgi:hypothetical protein
MVAFMATINFGFNKVSVRVRHYGFFAHSSVLVQAVVLPGILICLFHYYREDLIEQRQNYLHSRLPRTFLSVNHPPKFAISSLQVMFRFIFVSLLPVTNFS